MNLWPIFLLLIGGTILTVGDIVMKKWVISHNSIFYIIGLAIYLVGTMFLAYSFKFKNIAVASIIFVLFNVVTLTLISWFYFKEKLTGLELFGIFLGFLAVFVLELGHKP